MGRLGYVAILKVRKNRTSIFSNALTSIENWANFSSSAIQVMSALSKIDD